MKKSELKLLQERLQKASQPPPSKKRDDLSDELSKMFDDGTLLESGKRAPQPEVESFTPHPSGGQTPSGGQSTPPPTTAPKRARAPVAPERDFNKRANSLERDALPSGMFPGASKKIYDALYVRTRGAVKPCRTVRATKSDLSQWSGVSNRKTIDMHLRYLETCGLIERKWELGNTEGYLFEVRLPEETPLVDRGTEGDRPLEGTDQKRDRGTDQKMVSGGQSQPAENFKTSESPKTIFKTNTNNDDETIALSDLNSVFVEATRRLTGRAPRPAEREQWAEVARLLVAELDEAAARAGAISSVPAFLAAHLRRKLAPRPSPRKREGNRPPAVSDPGRPAEPPPPHDPDRRLTPEEVAEQARYVAEIVEGGYTMEQAEAQFAGGFHPEDWAAIKETIITPSTEGAGPDAT